MWAALLESCGIITQWEQALVVLVHIKLCVLYELAVNAGGAGGHSSTPSQSQRCIDPCGGLLVASGKSTSSQTRKQPGLSRASFQPSSAGEWPFLQHVLLHPVLGAVSDGQCRSFINYQTCRAHRALCPLLWGVCCLQVVDGQATNCTRGWSQILRQQKLWHQGQ